MHYGSDISSLCRANGGESFIPAMQRPDFSGDANEVLGASPFRVCFM